MTLARLILAYGHALSIPRTAEGSAAVTRLLGPTFMVGCAERVSMRLRHMAARASKESIAVVFNSAINEITALRPEDTGLYRLDFVVGDLDPEDGSFPVTLQFTLLLRSDRPTLVIYCNEYPQAELDDARAKVEELERHAALRLGV